MQEIAKTGELANVQEKLRGSLEAYTRNFLSAK